MHFLSDSEWMAINRLVLTINTVDDEKLFRRCVLKELRFLIPYESAAFYLTDLSKDLRGSPQQWVGSSILVDPIGIDIPFDILEEYTLKHYKNDYLQNLHPITSSRVFRERDLIPEDELDKTFFDDYMEKRDVLECLFACDKGFLGSLNLNRLEEQEPFTHRDVQILEIIEPHMTNRLTKWRLKADVTSGESNFAHKYRLSKRETEVVHCVFQGLDNRGISNELKVSEGTVKKHLENIFRKAGVQSRIELILSLKEFTDDSI